jgi:hypothetical protein
MVVPPTFFCAPSYARFTDIKCIFYTRGIIFFLGLRVGAQI